MTIEQLIAELQNPDEEARYQAILQLRLIDGPQAVTALIGALDDPSEHIRVRAALALGDMEAREAVPLLIDRLKGDASGPERALYADILSAIGDLRAVPALIEALKDPDKWVAKNACNALAILGDRQAVQPLLQVLEHPLWSVRYEACSALIELGVADDRLAAALNKLTQEPESAEYLHILESMQRELTRLKTSTDGEVGPAPDAQEYEEREFSIAIKELQAADPKVRKRAVLRLRRLATPIAVEALIGALNHTDAGVRSGAALALGELEAPEALPALIEHLLSDEAPFVRRMCAIFLYHFQDERAVEPLIQVLADSDPMLLTSASISLGWLGDPRAIPPLLRTLDHSDWDVRYNAAWALIRLKSADQRLVSALEQLAREPKAVEHDQEVDEHNSWLGAQRQVARDLDDPEPEPQPKLHQILEEARRLAAGTVA